MSRTALLNASGMLATLCALAAGGPAAAQTYTTFEWDFDTYPTTINAGGAVAGLGVDDIFSTGYVRAADGTTATFSPDNSEYTAPAAMNRKGSITGYYCEGSCVAHGFLRKPGGKIITFDPGGSTNTEPTAINNSGVITGFYDEQTLSHGFVRAADGTITTFDPPGSAGTTPTAINTNGDITGYYYESGVAHGFLRTADGTITGFDCKHATSTQALAINGKDAVAGNCESGGTTYGFERTSGGRMKVFAVQSSGLTLASGINDRSEIAGTYYGSDKLFHGFVGSTRTGFTSFDVPDGTETEASAINNDGLVTGSYIKNGDSYSWGFIRTP